MCVRIFGRYYGAMLWNGSFIRWKNGEVLRSIGIEWNESREEKMKTNKIGLLFLCLVAVIVLAVIIKDHDKNTAVSEYDHENPYFYTAEQTQIEYEGYFYTYSYRDIWQNIDLYITKLQAFESGVLYTLELEQLESTDTWDQIALGRRYLGYFYVTDKAIYCASFSPEASSAPEEGYTAAENEKIIHRIQTDETAFLEECYMVCCEDETADTADENGYHAFVEADGDRRIFRLYNDYFYGSKEYMLIVWEKGNGIVYYMHGNGAKNMHVEFGTDLERQQQTDYGYPYKLFHENADMTEQTNTSENITILEQTDMSETESAQFCSDGKIIAKLGDRQTELEPNMLSFPLQENIICVYEGLNNSSQLSAAGCIAGIYDTYVIYRETQENDIRFVNLLYSAQETGDLYAWKDQYLVPIVEQETGDFYVWNDGDLVLIGTQEKKQQDARENPKAKPPKDLPRENMTESELLEQTMDTLHRAGYDETNLIYDGTRHFLNRTYDVVSGFDDFPDHIIRGQEYYIDRETKNVYRVEEEAEFLRTELYYIDTLQ